MVWNFNLRGLSKLNPLNLTFFKKYDIIIIYEIKKGGNRNAEK